MERPFVNNVEAFFNEFIETIGGELVSKKVKLQDGILNCDYFFEKENILAELKCLEKDLFSEEDQERSEQLLDKWEKAGLIKKSDFISMFVGTKRLPNECLMELLMLCRRYYETAIKKAHKQVTATNKYLGDISTQKILFLCNDGNYFMSDYHALRTINLLLAMNAKWDFDCCVLFTINQVSYVPEDDLDTSFWAPTYGDKATDELQMFINKLGSKLNDFYCDRYNVPERKHKKFSGFEEGMKAIKSQKHIPKSIIYKK